jgi:transcriptional regulator with XRE-family HTH domain
MGAFVEATNTSLISGHLKRAKGVPRGRASDAAAELDLASEAHGLGLELVQEKELGEAGEGVSAEAAENFIEGKRIGERIKYLRQRKHMGLVELGKYTGLSASFLSQLETGRVVPTLRNLARIAMVFSKDLSYFFEPERPELFRIVRATDRQRLPQTGAEEPGYYFESLGQVPADQPIAPYVAEFLPVKEGRQAKAHRHTGNEFLYVLNGCMQLAHDGQVEQLASGDAVFFNAEAVHSYESIGDMACTALILSMPEALRGAHTGSRVPLSKAKSSVKK